MNDPTVQVTKRCSKCGEEKPYTVEFFAERHERGKKTWDGLRSTCRDCKRAAKRLRSTRKTPKWSSVVFAERFWSKVNKGGPVPRHIPELGTCWEWTGKTNAWGYGEIYYLRTRRIEKSHRLAMAFSMGDELPPVRWVLHRCDNPRCVRSDHLFLGDATENMRDKVAKGRQANGATRQYRMTPTTVREARLMRAAGAKQQEIADRFGVSQHAISRLLRGETWSHVA